MNEHKRENIRQGILAAAAVACIIVFNLCEANKSQDLNKNHKYRIEQEYSVGFATMGNPINNYPRFYWTDSLEKLDGGVKFVDAVTKNTMIIYNYRNIVQLDKP